MYSLYRAHITEGKDFHKRVTLQGKQHKKASTLFCGNGQNRTLCLPQHCSLYPMPRIRGKRVTQGLVILPSTEFGEVLVYGPHPSTVLSSIPGGAKP